MMKIEVIITFKTIRFKLTKQEKQFYYIQNLIYFLPILFRLSEFSFSSSLLSITRVRTEISNQLFFNILEYYYDY